MSLSKLLLAPCLIVLSLPSVAQLPSLPDKPWLGYFVGYERRDFRFGVKEDAEMSLECMNSRGTAMGFNKAIYFAVEVVESYPDRQSVKRIIPESLTSADKPTEDPEKITFKGKVTGDAEFECVIEFDGDQIKFGGRILNNGTLKNPLSFRISSRFQDAYKYTADDKVEAESKKDRIEFITLDKKRDKIGVFESVKLSADEFTGKGLSNLRIEMKPTKASVSNTPSRVLAASPWSIRASYPPHPTAVFPSSGTPTPPKIPRAKQDSCLKSNRHQAQSTRQLHPSKHDSPKILRIRLTSRPVAQRICPIARTLRETLAWSLCRTRMPRVSLRD